MGYNDHHTTVKRYQWQGAGGPNWVKYIKIFFFLARFPVNIVFSEDLMISSLLSFAQCVFEEI